MTIPALPALDRTSPTFRSDLDTFFLTQLPDTVTALNAEITRIEGITAAGLTGTSESSRTIAASGTFTFTVVSGTTKAFTAGQRVVIAASPAPSNQMRGYVTTYTPGTGDMVVAVDESGGGGTFNLWSIAVAAPAASPYYVGDIALTNRTLVAPAWLPADGAVYSQSSYTALYAELGMLRTGAMQPFITGAVLGAGIYDPAYCAPLVHSGALYAYSWTSGTSAHKLNRTVDGATITGTASLTNTAAATAYIGLAAIGTTMLALPPNGNAWVSRSTDTGSTFASQPVGGMTGQTRIMVIGSLFVILSGTTAYWTSPDGAVWTARTLPAVLPQITLGNGIAIGATNTSTTTTYTTADGITWTARTMPVSQTWQAVDAYYNPASSVWLMYGGGGSGVWARSTDNGATWSSVTIVAGATVTPTYNGSFNSTVRVFNGRFILYSQLSFADAILSSSDGATWSALECPPLDARTSYETYNAMWVLGSELYIGSGAALWQTSDGVTWRRMSNVQNQQQVGYWRFVYEIGNNQIAVYASDTTLRRRPIYTYDSTTQFAVPQVQTAPGVTAYVKT